MRILIVKTSSLGDIIHAFPTLAFLRKKYPEALIDWVVEKPFAELVRAHPEVNEVLTVETKAWRKSPFSPATWKAVRDFRRSLQSHSYDLMFDLQGNVKSGLITLQARAKTKVGFGKKTVAERPNSWLTTQQFDPPPGSNIRSDYLFLAQSACNDFSPFTDAGVQLKMTPMQQQALEAILANPLLQKGPLVMVCPGSAWRNKQLSDKALEQFLQKLQGHLSCTFLLIWGNSEERALAEALSHSVQALVVDRLPLPALQNLMGRMQLVISMDSLPLHLAGTTATPSFSVFGASYASKYKPEGERHQSFQGACPYGRTFEKRCPILRTCLTGSCIRDLSGETLFQYFLNNCK